MQKKFRLLLIEDNEDDALFILRALELSGFTIENEIVKTAAMFRKMLEQPWDIIISDYHLPGFGGHIALSMVKEMGLSIPFIIVSGRIGEDVAVALINDGASDYVMKDNLKKLPAAIEKALQQIEVKRMARKGESQQNILASVVKNTNHGVMITDANGLIEWVNDGFVKLTGYSSAESMGKKPGLLLQGPDTDAETVAYISRQIKNKQSAQCEILNYTKSGRQLWLDLQIHPIFNASGDTEKFFSYLVDVTERKLLSARETRINEQLEKKILEATVKHQALLLDIQENYSVILSNIQNLFAENNVMFDKALKSITSKINADEEKIFNTINLNTRVLETTLNNTLEFVNLSNKKVELQEVNIQSQVYSILNHIKLNYPTLQLDLTIDELPTVSTDSEIINAVLQHILSNAFKFSKNKEKFRLKISYSLDGNKHLFRITDNGVGFDMKNHDSLFIHFNRIFTQSEFQGSGMGLSNTKRFLEKLNGNIWAESNPGQGSTFCFTLPVN
jgi:PAS domain S-box-containing protein